MPLTLMEIFCFGPVLGVGGEEGEGDDKPGTAVVIISVLVFRGLLKSCFCEVSTSLVHPLRSLFILKA